VRIYLFVVSPIISAQLSHISGLISWCGHIALGDTNLLAVNNECSNRTYNIVWTFVFLKVAHCSTGTSPYHAQSAAGLRTQIDIGHTSELAREYTSAHLKR
jgi:hypothetical protein